VPWSACTIVEPQRFLLATAMLTALSTSAVSGVVENVRATIFGEKQSRLAQQQTFSSRGRVFGDVGAPQFVGARCGELQVKRKENQPKSLITRVVSADTSSGRKAPTAQMNGMKRPRRCRSRLMRVGRR
jgi:hypothetical protein